MKVSLAAMRACYIVQINCMTLYNMQIKDSFCPKGFQAVTLVSDFGPHYSGLLFLSIKHAIQHRTVKHVGCNFPNSLWGFGCPNHVDWSRNWGPKS